MRRLATTWPVGPRMDELIHRARAYRRHVKKEPLDALSYIPSKGYGSLPHSDAELNPNLVRVYVDTQHDYLLDRVYLVGARVEACEDGMAKRSRSIVHVTDGPPEDPAQEKKLLVDWTRDLLEAVVDLAFPDTEGLSRAPVHLIFYNRFGFRLLLDALGRNFQEILGETPPLYDFLTQVAGFDSPVVTFLEQEIQEFQNYPILCQSLQSVAIYLGFDWDQPQPFREIFRQRLFDYVGKLDSNDENSEWYTRRARFNSQVPLEYAYAAWKQLPAPPDGKADPFAPFRPTTLDALKGFLARRLEALAWIAARLPGNRQSEKAAFNLPELGDYTDKAHSLARALDEFVTIERHVELGDWKSIHHAPPERRVLMGETLLLRYRSADQEPEVAKCVESGAGGSDGMSLRLRLETTGLDCDLEEALSLCGFRPDDWLVLYPRWTCDERLPEEDRTFFTPTPRQMLYGQRVVLNQIVVDGRDQHGRAASGHVEVSPSFRFARGLPGFVFPGIRKARKGRRSLHPRSLPERLVRQFLRQHRQAVV